MLSTTTGADQVVPPLVVEVTLCDVPDDVISAQQLLGFSQVIASVDSGAPGIVWAVHVLPPSALARISATVEFPELTPSLPPIRHMAILGQEIAATALRGSEVVVHETPPSFVTADCVPLFVVMPAITQWLLFGQTMVAVSMKLLGIDWEIQVVPPSVVVTSSGLPENGLPAVAQQSEGTGHEMLVIGGSPDGSDCRAQEAPPSVVAMISLVIMEPTDASSPPAQQSRPFAQVIVPICSGG